MTRHPKADPQRIAVLEYELLYVRPEPGSVGEAAVQTAINAGDLERHHACGSCDRYFRPDEEWCPACTVCPQHGNLCNRPLPGEYDCPNALSVLAQRAA